ncbi:hypothetical protein LTR08_006384 [Meristemomyces frigidus]|nr:hypothetical protein LTR08_006384 [Meristemomyces frigidus]
MGQRQSNRKQVRHRPMKGIRKAHLSATQPIDIDHVSPLAEKSSQTQYSCIYSASSSIADSPHFYGIDGNRQSSQPTDSLESAAAREQRVFGGGDGDVDDREDLRGAMLDVVLGLFGGLDYHDRLI